jgi:agmatinase
MFKTFAAIAALVVLSYAHDHDHDQEPISGPHQKLWYNVLPGDGGTQVLLIELHQLLVL